MAQEIKKTPIDLAKERYEANLKLANDALGENPQNLVKYNEAIVGLDEAEKDYAKCVAKAIYAEYADKPNAVVELIKLYHYDVISHKEKRSDSKENPKVIAVEPITKKRQIDLLAFCNQAKLDTTWEVYGSRCNQLMCLRIATQLGADVKKISNSYFLRDKVKEINMGKTPTSVTQCCKLLQQVIDLILPTEEDGKSTYKVNSHDIAYLDGLYGKKSNQHILTVRVSNDAFFRRILIDICYRLVTGSKYGVDGYKGYKE